MSKTSLLHVALAVSTLLGCCSPVFAQSGSVQPQEPSQSFGIVDNSFLVEEAFNQDPRIFQNIFTFTRDSSGWAAVFTQEWPAPGRRHQLSYTIPLEHDQQTAVGDLRLNYRYQVLNETATIPACAPRLTVILPSGKVHPGLRRGRVGWEFNVPFSKRAGDVYLHWNVGATHLPATVLLSGRIPSPTTPAFAGSVVWRTQPMVNVMFEVLALFPETLRTPDARTREKVVTVSPGIRRGWNIDDSQVVAGIAAPLTFEAGEKRLAVLAYGSYELPFSK